MIIVVIRITCQLLRLLGCIAGSPSFPSTSSAPAVDSDISNEALESHHMVVVMAVLVTCPHLKRIRLDSNKVHGALGWGGGAPKDGEGGGRWASSALHESSWCLASTEMPIYSCILHALVCP